MDKWLSAKDVYERFGISQQDLVFAVWKEHLKGYDPVDFSPIEIANYKVMKEKIAENIKSLPEKFLHVSGDNKIFRWPYLQKYTQERLELLKKISRIQASEPNHQIVKISEEKLILKINRQQYNKFIFENNLNPLCVIDIIESSCMLFKEEDIISLTSEPVIDNSSSPTKPVVENFSTRERGNLLKIIGGLMHIHYLHGAKSETYLKKNGNPNYDLLAKSFLNGLEKCGFNGNGIGAENLRKNVLPEAMYEIQDNHEGEKKI